MEESDLQSGPVSSNQNLSLLEQELSFCSPSPTPSKPLIDKFQGLDNLWSAQKVKSAVKRKEDNNDDEDDEIDSQMSQNSRLFMSPSKPLLDKLQSLEQTWSAVKSVGSSRRSRSRLLEGSSFSPSFSSFSRPTATLIDRSVEVEDAAQSLSSPSRNRLYYGRPRVFEPDQYSDHQSVGESTISTLSSNEEYDPQERQSQQPGESTKKPKRSTPKAGNRRNSRLDTPASHLLPKTNIGSRLRDRIGAFQAETRSLGRASSQISPFPPPRNAIYSDYYDNEEDEHDSVFHRLYRNEKRPQPLWTAPPVRLPVRKSPPSNASTPRQSKQPKVSPKSKWLNQRQESQSLQEKPSPTIEDEIMAIQAVGKELETLQAGRRSQYTTPMEDDEANFSPARKLYFSKPITKLPRVDQPSIESGTSLTRSSSDEKASNDNDDSHRQRTTSKSDPFPSRPQSPPAQATTSSVKSGFYTLDHPSGGLVLEYHGPTGTPYIAKRITQLTTPHKRRLDRQASSDDDAPLLTPKRILLTSCITVQNCWRCHRAQLNMAARLLQTYHVDVSFAKTNYDRMFVPHCRVMALANAVKKVDCWWILEGLHVEPDRVTVSWEKEVDITFQSAYGMQVLDAVTVSLHCEAKRSFITEKWSRRKLAILFCKVALQKAWNDERLRRRSVAAERIQRWMARLSANRTAWAAVTIQRWLRRRTCEGLSSGIAETDLVDTLSTWRTAQETLHQEPNKSRSEVSSSPEETDLKAFAAVVIQSWLRMVVAKSEFQRELSASKAIPAQHEKSGLEEATSRAFVQSTPSEEEESPAVEEAAIREHNAIVTIQSWLRMCALQSALNHSSDSTSELQLALSNHSCSPQKRLIEARQILRSSLSIESYVSRSNPASPERRQIVEVETESDLFKTWDPATYNLIERRASAVAIQRIVHAYLTGLKRHRRNRKATSIQAFIRRCQAGHLHALKCRSAILVQHVWRRYRCHNYDSKAAIKVQRVWKSILVRRAYQNQKFSTLIIQSTWRRALAERNRKKAVGSAIALQRTVRAIHLRKEFLTIRKAAVAIQRSWRQQRDKQRGIVHNACAVTIQCAWRKHTAQSYLTKMVFASIIVQRTVQSFLIRRHFVSSRKSLLLIQCTWRSYHARNVNMLRNKSALKLQSHRRIVVARKQLVFCIFAATTVQRMIRGKLARESSLAMIKASVVIQRARRARCDRIWLLKMKVAALRIQSTWRTTCVQRQYWEWRRSCVTLQKHSRGYRLRQRHLLLRKSAIVIQRRWHRRQERVLLEIKLASSVLVQSMWRQKVARNQLSESVSAAIKIQSISRASVKRKHFLTLRGAMVCFQRQWYRKRRRKALAELERSTVVVQSYWRRRLEQERLYSIRRLCILVQSMVRGYLSRTRLRKWDLAAIACQCIWRGVYSREQIRTRLRSATTIQSNWRRQCLQKRLTMAISSAIVLQNASRRLLARSRFVSAMTAATTIQAAYRGYREKAIFRHICIAAIEVQRVSRGKLARVLRIGDIKERSDSRLHDNAVRIQSAWRCSLAQSNFIMARASAIMLQGLVKGMLLRRSQQQVCGGVVKVQGIWRGRSARRLFIQRTKERSDSQLHDNAVRIQSAWRCSLARSNFIMARASAIMLQGLVKGMLLRRSQHQVCGGVVKVQGIWRGRSARRLFIQRTKERSDSRLHGNAVRIQSAWRCSLARSNLMAGRSSVIMLQALGRGVLLRRPHQRLRGAVIEIQRLWRGRAAKIVFSQTVHAIAESRLLRARSSILIQQNWRLYQSKRQFLAARVAVIKIQSLARMHQCLASMATSRVQLDEDQRQFAEGIQCIQRRWRTSAARSRYGTARSSAIMIQALSRGFLLQVERRKQDKSIESAIMMQALSRSFLLQEERRKQDKSIEYVQADTISSEQEMLAALNIQRMFRGTQYRALRDHHNECALKIQCAWITYCLHKFVTLPSAAVLIQSMVRQHFAQSKVAESSLRRDRNLQQDRAAVKVQQAWRSRMCEKNAHRKRSSLDIQRFWRGAVAREYFGRVRTATITTEAMTRARLASLEYKIILLSCAKIQASIRRKLSSIRFEAAVSAAQCIQKNWRAASSRFVFITARSSALTIESLSRGYILRVREQRIREKATAIQRLWRGTICRHRNLRTFGEQAAALRTQRERNVVVTIQRYWRGSVAREYFGSVRIVVIAIQTSTRGRLVSAHYKRVLHSCVKIQASMRRKLSVIRFKTAILAIRCMQKHWRASLFRFQFATGRSSVTKIQSLSRRFILRAREQRAHEKAAAIQRRWRGIASRRRYIIVRYDSLATRLLKDRNATSIQKVWRVYHAQCVYLISLSAAINIKSETRRHLAIGNVATMKSERVRTAVLIQRSWRMRKERCEYLIARSAAIRIQCQARQNFTVSKLATLASERSQRVDLERNSAATVQAFLRTAYARKRYLELLTSSRIIQRTYRGHVYRVDYCNTRQRIIEAQNVWRGALCRMKLEANRRLHAYRLKRATLVIQNVVAYFVFQRRARRNYASVIIQASWRESLVREHYCSVSVAAIAMQSMVRGRLSLVSYRRMLHASLILQTYIRWRQATKRFKECVFAILCIQKYWRGSLSRHSLMVARASAIFIQALTRGILTRHAYEYFIMPPEEREAFDDAARRIQVAFYMWMMQMAVLEMNSSAVLLRRSVRGQLVRSAAKFALTHMNSSFRSRSLASFSRVVSSSDPEVISTTVAWNVAVNFAKSSASIVIQSAARRMIARKYVIFLFGRSFGSSARIAAQREEEQRSAATLLIQRSFRLWSAGRRGPAILIQKTFRAWNARNLFSQGVEARDLQQKQPNSAMLVQALARGLLSRKTHAQTIAAAVSVQTAHRRYLAQISFRYRKAFEARELQQKRSTLAMLVQALARRSTARKVFVQKVAAAVTIQNVNRRFLAQTSFLRYRVAALAAQRVARGWIGRRKSERRQAASILVTRSSLFEKALSSRSQVDEVYSRIVRKAEKVSAKVFGSLLEDRLSGDAGPCLLRLANRVRNTLDDANFVSKNALDETDIFGVGAIAEELASKKQGGDQMVAPDVSTPSKKQAHQSYSATGLPQIEASPPSPQKADTRVSRKVETPVRCNRTPTAQSFFACLDYEKDQDTKPTARVISLDFKPADFDAKATPDQRIAPPAEKPSKPEAKTLPKVAPSGSDASARLAAEAKRLLSLGRQVLHSKPAAAPAEPKISLTTPYETATATKKNDAGDEQLFGQAEEEPLSPIKAETNWDWADEW